MDSVENKAGLAEINPIDCSSVYVVEEKRRYDFDYTSTAEPDGDRIIAVGSFDPEHPTHAAQPFMTGCWIAASS